MLLYHTSINRNEISDKLNKSVKARLLVINSDIQNTMHNFNAVSIQT